MLAHLLQNQPLVMAPMAGITDRPWRNLCRAFGCDLAYTEMVSAKALTYGNRRTFDLLDTSADTGLTLVQLFGSTPEDLAQGALLAQKAGARAIDINMGCPVPKVAGQGEGSGLLQRPQVAWDMVAATTAAVSLPVTVKMRIGWDAPLDDLAAFARGLEAAGAKMLAVHGRTRAQYYAGQADWGAIRRVVEAVQVPVLANGDVGDLPSYHRILERTGAAGVMVGRAALGAPWLFRAFKTGDRSWERPPVSLRIRVFSLHARQVCALSGEKIGMQKMRKFFAWYFKGLPHSAGFRREAFAMASLEDMEALLDRVGQTYGIVP